MSTTLHFATAGFGAWAVYLAGVAIANVQQYESATQQAAKLSQVAEDQLRYTRITLTAGAVASLISVVCALEVSLSGLEDARVRAGMAVINAAATLLASDQVTRFWFGKVKVPMVDQYNKAIDKSNMLRRVLAGLGAIWSLDAVVQGWAAVRA